MFNPADGVRFNHNKDEAVSMKEQSFYKELEILINRYSKENESNTPDYILSEYIQRCLLNFTITTKDRDKWWGFDCKKNVFKEE